MPHLKDIPSRLLAAVVARMPDDRREWGNAMLAELAQLQGPVCRWNFTVSCLRVALFPPAKHEPNPLAMIKSTLPLLGAIALAAFALLQPEISGAGLAWAYTVYGIAILAIPTALFGNLFVLAGVAFVVTGHARGWQPWPKTAWLRSSGRFVVEIVFGLLNPLLYLSILATAFTLRPSDSDWWLKPLMIAAWILLFVFWIARACGAAFNPRSPFARVGVQVLLFASLACVLAFAVKDAWLFVSRESFGLNQILHLLRLCPLYLVPALLLWDYLRFSPIAPPKEDTEQPARPAGSFFLLPDRISRFAITCVVAAALVTGTLAAHRRSEGSVRKLVGAHRASIQSAATHYNVDPRLIASIVYVTHRDQLSPFRDAFERLIINTWGVSLQRRGPGNERWEEIGTDENPLLNIALDISVGLAQIKPRTAQTASVLATGQTPDSLEGQVFYEYRNVEPVGEGWPPEIVEKLEMDSPIPVPTERREVGRLLLNAEANLQTCALILALYQKQWEATDPDWSIRERPDILATLYQIGFARSNPHGAPQSNAFGARVRQVSEQPWLREMFAR